MSNISDISRDEWMLRRGPLAAKGYDWWWHSFTGTNERTGERKSFFIEFFTCNPAHAKIDPVIVWNDCEKQADNIKPSYVMVKAGYWGKEKAQINNFYSYKDVYFKPVAPFAITVGDCFLCESGTVGRVSVTNEEAKEHPEWMSDSGTMEWNLNMDKKISFNVGYGASKLFRVLNAFEMFWHAEGMKTAYDGYVTVNGEKYIVSHDDSYGYADKNWGSDFTSPWVWLSSNNLMSASTGEMLTDSAFNIGGGRPKVLGVPLNRKLLSQLTYEYCDFEFNFSKFLTGTRTKFSCKETEDKIIWDVTQKNLKFKLVAHVECEKDEMILMNYESPDGRKRHNRLWNGGTGVGVLKIYRRSGFGTFEMIDKIYAKNIGCEYGVYDENGVE